MADLATVFFGAQLGKETVPGTGVAASKLLGSLGFSRPIGQGDGTMFRPQGSKLNTASVPPGKRWTNVACDGVMTYDELAYIFDSLIKTVTPVADGTNGKKWVWSFAKSASDPKTTYTYESGNPTHAQKCTYLQCNNLTLEMSHNNNHVTANWIAQAIQDDVVITPGPTEIAFNIIAPQSFDVYFADTQAALAGASVFGRPFMATLNIPDVVQPLFRMNSTDTSFINLIEQPVLPTLQVSTDADDAGMALLTQLTGGSTKFVRVKAVGAVIAGAMASAYTFILDFSGKVIRHYDPTDDNGSAKATWTFENVYDPTWTKAIEITLINTLAAL